MNIHTAAVIIISDQILSGKKDLNSYVTLPLALAPKWDIKKLLVLPPNPQLVKYELKTAFKMCEIVVVIQEIINVDFTVCDVVASVFHERVGRCSAVCELGNFENTPFKFLSFENDAKNVTVPVISFHRIFVLQGNAASIISAFGVLKMYLSDYKREIKYKKRFEITLNEDDSFQRFIDELKISDIEMKIEKLNEKYVVNAEALKLTRIIALEGKIVDEFGTENVSHMATDLNIFDSFYFQVDSHISQTVKVNSTKLHLKI